MSFRKSFGSFLFAAGMVFFIGLILTLVELRKAQAKIPDDLRVVGVSILGKTEIGSDVGLGERLQIEIKGPKGSGVDTSDFAFKSLILYLDNRPLVDHHPIVKPTFAARCAEKEASTIDAIIKQREGALGDTKKIEDAEANLTEARKRQQECGDTVFLTFELIRNQESEDSRKVWSALLGTPRALNRTVQVEVGLPGGERIPPMAASNPR